MRENELNRGEFESQFRPQIQPLPTNPRTVKEYEEKANPDLKVHNRRIVKNDYYQLMKSSLFGLGIFCVVLLYLMYGGYTKDEINIPDCVCPNISIPSCPELNCPNPAPCPTCNCPACHNMCDYPDDISITITNQTE